MPPTEMAQWVAEPLPRDVQQALSRLARDEDVRRIAVMPDVHLSKEVCVGVAVATATTLIPAAVGGDIGCGMQAVAFEADASILAERKAAAQLLEALYETIPVLRHKRSAQVELPPALGDTRLSNDGLEATKAKEAALQFGTLGRGNHFLEFQADEVGGLWLMVHTGSRGMGQAIREAHEQAGQRSRAGLQVLRADTPEGDAYLHDVRWALAYAARSRERIVSEVGAIMSRLFDVDTKPQSTIACHHNFVRRERHEGEHLWVHRKGAISAADGEPGIIPGSMGAPSFHVIGRGCARALCSSAHGAGRVMSRAAARHRITKQRLHDSMEGIWFDHRRAHRLVDEAPDAYKDIGAVMRAQRTLTRPVRKLLPVLSFKAT